MLQQVISIKRSDLGGARHGVELADFIVLGDCGIDQIQTRIVPVVLLQEFKGLWLRLDQNAAHLVALDQFPHVITGDSIESADLQEFEIVRLQEPGRHDVPQRVGDLPIGVGDQCLWLIATLKPQAAQKNVAA